jgi:hypothetical protein
VPKTKTKRTKASKSIKAKWLLSPRKKHYLPISSLSSIIQTDASLFHRLLWVPSHNGPLADCLHPQK